MHLAGGIADVVPGEGSRANTRKATETEARRTLYRAAQRIILTDNGDVVDDEIDVVTLGDDCGWPYTAGKQPAVPGTRAPVYVFPTVVAPTGLLAARAPHA